MMKSLLVLALMASVAAADTRVYDVKATRRVDMSDSIYPSCGATKRMLKDKHVIRIKDDGTVTINHQKWVVEIEEPDLMLSFHYGKGQKTYLMMDMYVNMRGLTGKYVLVGKIPDPEDPRKQETCTDAVYVDGTAR